MSSFSLLFQKLSTTQNICIYACVCGNRIVKIQYLEKAELEEVPKRRGMLIYTDATIAERENYINNFILR